MRLLTLVLTLVLGCGDVLPVPDAQTETGDDGVRSGSRLKVSWETYDGARSASPLLVDSQRNNELCIPRAWSDGRTYCTPRTSLVVYGNAGCTQPLALVPATTCGTPTSYFHETDPTTCGTLPAKIYERGVQSALTQYWTKDALGCSGPVALGASTLYVVGVEVPLSAFVELTPSAVDRSTRITQRYYEGRDGTRLFSSQHDAELDLDCSMSVDPELTMGRCVPSSLGAVTAFADSACTERRMEARTGCELPKFAFEIDLNCPLTASATRYYRPGALAARAPLFEKVGAACQMSTARTGADYYTLQAPIALGTLPRTPDAYPDRRIQVMHYSTGGGQLRDPRFYDTLKAVECTSATFGGVTRCLPIDPFGIATGYFTDPACQIATSVVEVRSTAGCGAPPAPKFARRTISPLPGQCNVGVEIRAVGAAYTTPLYVRTGVDCVIADTTRTRYMLGEVVPLSEFATATISIDP